MNFMADSNLISQREALDYLNDKTASFVDGSWYLPSQQRNGWDEYLTERIPSAVFFDIDAISDPSSGLPHMLPSPEAFAKSAGALGLTHDKTIIVYDGPGMFSAARVWWTLKTMGAKDVRILKGGFDTWRKEGLPVEKGAPRPPMPTVFETHFSRNNVANMSLVEENIASNSATVLDARPNDRFKGEAPEPREGMRSGHIPNSKSLPASDLISNGTLLEQEQLEQIFQNLKLEKDASVITTCGSGVTAAIIALALAETGRYNTRLYDGSWAEWGQKDGPEISTND
jgi:thiosulfate/3-mercaptopyruvate sulfurtransferase